MYALPKRDSQLYPFSSFSPDRNVYKTAPLDLANHQVVNIDEMMTTTSKWELPERDENAMRSSKNKRDASQRKPLYALPDANIMHDNLYAIELVVSFWETDFRLNSVFYPKMSKWEKLQCVPDQKRDPKSWKLYLAMKELSEKWSECNKSLKQWIVKYQGYTHLRDVIDKNRNWQRRRCVDVVKESSW